VTPHNETPRVYTEPAWADYHWVIEERDPATGDVTAEYGYPTESAAGDAYNMLTQPKGDA
jgi:hypothetical protein